LRSVLIDSDILIEVSRGRDSAILAQWREVTSADAVVVCSAVTIAEIWSGARPREHVILIGLFAVLTCVPIDSTIGRRAGEYLERYSKSHRLELGDALIAATAAVHSLALWTRNTKHYPMKDISLYGTIR